MRNFLRKLSLTMFALVAVATYAQNAGPADNKQLAENKVIQAKPGVVIAKTVLKAGTTDTYEVTAIDYTKNPVEMYLAVVKIETTEKSEYVEAGDNSETGEKNYTLKKEVTKDASIVGNIECISCPKTTEVKKTTTAYIEEELTKRNLTLIEALPTSDTSVFDVTAYDRTTKKVVTLKVTVKTVTDTREEVVDSHNPDVVRKIKEEKTVVTVEEDKKPATTREEVIYSTSKKTSVTVTINENNKEITTFKLDNNWPSGSEIISQQEKTVSVPKKDSQNGEKITVKLEFDLNKIPATYTAKVQ